MGDGQAQMRDAGFEVVQKTRRRARQFALEALDEFFLGQTRQHRRGRRVSGLGQGFEFSPALLRNLALQIAHSMREASLAQALRKHLLDRTECSSVAAGRLTWSC